MIDPEAFDLQRSTPNRHSALSLADSNDSWSDHGAARNWFAVFTIPQNEKSVATRLQLRGIEVFLPTYETVRVWKNRQRVRLVLPLFPSYLFVFINTQERRRVLESSGVLRIVGNHREPVPIANSTIAFLRSDLCKGRIEPHNELVIGQKVRIKSGAMQGLEGNLIRKNNNLRFVLSISLINQYAAVEICAEDLEPVAG